MNPEQLALVRTAQIAHGAGRVEEALESFARAAALNSPGEVHAYDMAGHCYAALGRSTEAVEVYKKFVEHEPDSAAVWSNLSALCFNLADYSFAARSMGEVLRLNGPSRDGMLLRFLCLYFAGEDDPIPALLHQYVELYANDYANTEKFLEYVNANTTTERRDKAMDMYLEAGKHLLPMVHCTAKYYARTNRGERAIQIFEAYLRSKVRILQSEMTEAYATLGELLLASGDAPKAIDRMQQGMTRIRMMSYGVRLANILGYAHARAGRPEVALDFFRVAAAQEPNFRFTIVRPSFRG